MLPKIKIPKQTVYLDHAATTPLDPAVAKAMRPYLAEKFGNPSSLYKAGVEAKTAISHAREKVAQILNCSPKEIIFTAGGTESTNLAIFGTAKKFKPGESHIVTSQIEHHAVVRPVEALGKEGYRTTFVKANGTGIIALNDIKKAIRPQTVLVSIMYANNEVGTIQPIREIGKWLRAENARRAKKSLPYIAFHVDACQAGTLNLDVQNLSVDLLTLNGSKNYGPKQTGVLFARISLPLKPLIYGGGQEAGLRSGTENVAGIVGFAKALTLIQTNRVKENKRLEILRDYFIKRVLKEIPKSVINGSMGKGERLPSNINVSFDGVDGEALLLYLDSYNIAVSTGSACSTVDNLPSHVLKAMGFNKERIAGAIRFTLGKSTTKKQLDFVINVLKPLIKELRKA